MKRPKHAGGRLYRRKSRCTGKDLATWTMVFIDATGKKVRESTGKTDFKEAQSVLSIRLGEIAQGTYIPPDRTRLTVGDMLDAVSRSTRRRSIGPPARSPRTSRA